MELIQSKTRILPWQRFWFEKDKVPNTSDGFLHIWGTYYHVAFPFESFSDTPCLVLLGEPGTGKSTEIHKIFESLQPQNSELKHFFDLGSAPNHEYVLREVFDSTFVKEWMEGTGILNLFLDGIDEALKTISNFSKFFINEISKLPINRLRIRLACRSAEWSSSVLSDLETELQNAFEKGAYLAITIAPLRAEDVIVAARDRNLDDRRFMNEIIENRVGHLAAIPRTLKFLLNEFESNEQLSSNQFDLYQRGLLQECESGAGLELGGGRNKLTREQRFRIAARIAAVLSFSNRTAIWIGADDGDKTEQDVPVDELAGYIELEPDGTAFHVGETEINETLYSCMFSGAGPHRIQFDHQTSLEFMSAWYVVYRELRVSTIKQLLGEDYSYPQLDEIAAWISIKQPELYKHLIRNSPLVLLRSQVFASDDDLRADLAARILEVFDKFEAFDGWVRDYYSKLCNRRIADQLRPFIRDSSKGWLVRRVAIDVAEKCKVIELQHDLADVALDVTELHQTRVNAAYAVVNIGDADARKRLMPLIHDVNDENLELKGRGLAAAWPEFLSSKELFEVLEPPLLFFTGSYSLFFYEFESSLSREHLLDALKWITEKTIATGVSTELRRLTSRCVILAWKYIDDPGVFSRLVDVIRAIISSHEDVLEAPNSFSESEYAVEYRTILSDSVTRRKIWNAIVRQPDERVFFGLHSSRVLSVRGDDVEWLIESFIEEKDRNVKYRIVATLRRFIGPWESDPGTVEKIKAACDKNDELNAEFGPLFDPINLQSTQAKEQKEYFDKYLRHHNENETNRQPEEISPSPLEKTLSLLEQIESGDLSAWWRLNIAMAFRPDGTTDKTEYDVDLTSFPVWEIADSALRRRILKAAQEYLQYGEPDNADWVGTNVLHRPAMAGYRAICLVEKLENSFLDGADRKIWEKWAAAVFHYPIFNGSGSEEYENHRRRISRTYGNASEAIISLLNNEIDLKPDDAYWAFEKVVYCWDSRLIQFAKEKLSFPDLPHAQLRRILSKLFEYKDEYAVEYSRKFLKEWRSKWTTNPELLFSIVEILISNTEFSCWDIIWEIFTTEKQVARKIVEFGVGRFETANLNKVPPKILADLFIWLSTEYPHDEDPIHRGSYSPGPRDEIVTWRESLLNALKARGNNESIDEIGRIRAQLPGLEYLQFVEIESRALLREKAWHPKRPTEIVKLVQRDRHESNVEKADSQYSAYKSEKDRLDVHADRLSRFQMMETWFVVSFFTLVWVGFVMSVGWNEMEIWTWVASALIYIVLSGFASWYLEDSWYPLSAEKVKQRTRTSVYSGQGFDVLRGEILYQEVLKHKRELEEFR